jgi:hypothetical protein
MAKAREEQSSPQMWLNRLAAEGDAYARLVAESGGIARAAYRLAHARCKVASDSGDPPTLEDLQEAARLLSVRVGRGGVLPITSLLPGASSNFPVARERPRSAPPPPPAASRSRAEPGRVRPDAARAQ